MLNFEFPLTHPVEEALIGNVHRFDIKINRLKNINLQNMKLDIENLPSDVEKSKEIDEQKDKQKTTRRGEKLKYIVSTILTQPQYAAHFEEFKS